MTSIPPSKSRFYEIKSFKPYTAILRDKRRAPGGSATIAEWLSLLQGLYYVLLGLWGLLGFSSFPWVISPQTDTGWIQGFASLLLVIGIVLVVAALRRVLSLELGLLMIGSSLGLAGMDLTYFLRGDASYFYRIDGIEEAVVLALCLLFLSRFTHRRHSTFV